MLLILPVRQFSIKKGSNAGRISRAHFLEKILTNLAEWQNKVFYEVQMRAINEQKLCMLNKH